MVTNLERMGDYAVHLAQMATVEEYEDCIPFVEQISEMALLGATMTRKAVEAFMDVKAEKAIEVAAMDDRMDEARRTVNAGLVSVKPSSEKKMERLYNLFYLAKEMERFGDHVTTICSWIVYMANGERPKLNLPKEQSEKL